MIKGLGWHPPTTEPLHPKFCAHFTPMSSFMLPLSVDLRPECPPVYDQGNLGSCTANASGGLAHFLVKKLDLWNFMPSRLAEYYWTRVFEGDPGQDNGASVQDAVNTMTTYGVANEALWWYDVAKFAVKPGKNVVNDAAKHIVSQVYQINQNETEMKTCLSMGYPFAIGFTVYSSFDNIGSDGVMPMPAAGESVLGGHAVLVVGYDDSRKMFIVRNSWGTSWGVNGYFYMPTEFILGKDASDFWTAHMLTLKP